MFKKLRDQFTKREVVALLDFSYQALTIETEAAFKRLVLDLKHFMPFENAVCASVNLVDFPGSGDLELSVNYCNISYPAGYLDDYFENDDFSSDAVLAEFLTTLSPVNWSAVDEKCDFNYPASIKALEYNMRDGWADGTLNPVTVDLTTFFLGNSVKDDNSARSENVLQYATPFLVGAYERLLQKATPPPTPLTAKETEVLNWIKDGKSSWEISKILRCSKRTVDFHVNNIKAKLGVVTRAQAVAIGLQHGFIHF